MPRIHAFWFNLKNDFVFILNILFILVKKLLFLYVM
jgi:hypothetical protein